MLFRAYLLNALIYTQQNYTKANNRFLFCIAFALSLTSIARISFTIRYPRSLLRSRAPPMHECLSVSVCVTFVSILVFAFLLIHSRSHFFCFTLLFISLNFLGTGTTVCVCVYFLLFSYRLLCSLQY